MKKPLWLIAIALMISLPAYGWIMAPVVGGVAVVGGDECSGKLVCQNFEGTGYDNGESWGNSATANPDYAGGAVLRGSQSIQLDADNASPTADINFSDTGEVWIHFLWSTSYDVGIFREILVTRDNSETNIATTIRYAGGTTDKWSLVCGTTVNNQADTYNISVDTTYHIWARLKASDGTGDLYVGTTTTRPETPVVSIASCNSAASTIGFARLTDLNWQSAGNVAYIDQVLIDDVEISSVQN